MWQIEPLSKPPNLHISGEVPSLQQHASYMQQHSSSYAQPRMHGESLLDGHAKNQNHCSTNMVSDMRIEDTIKRTDASRSTVEEVSATAAGIDDHQFIGIVCVTVGFARANTTAASVLRNRLDRGVSERHVGQAWSVIH